MPAGSDKRSSLHDRCQADRTLRDHEGMDQLAAAFDRIDDFVAVQNATGGITTEAVELLQRAAGVGDRERAVIAQRVSRATRRSPTPAPADEASPPVRA